MASITINPINDRIDKTTSIIGDENLIMIKKDGRPSIVPINSLLGKLDDDIVDRIDDQVIEKVEDQLDDMIDERLENIDPECNLKWNNVL